MKKKLRNLWRAELRKEAAVWWESLSQTQKIDFACGRTEEEVADYLITAKIAVFQKPLFTRCEYEEYSSLYQ